MQVLDLKRDILVFQSLIFQMPLAPLHPGAFWGGEATITTPHAAILFGAPEDAADAAAAAALSLSAEGGVAIKPLLRAVQLARALGSGDG
jgi:hypothetical protein